MARAAKTQETEEKIPGTALINWEAELAREAEAAAAMEANAGGGQFFSTRGGVLALNDVPMPDNQMAVVIIDSILENLFYEGAFDSDNITPPTCFAFGRDDLKMAPHENVVEAGQAQSDKCQGCPMNEFGTAERGKGKACGNRRRLALLSAGELLPNGKLKDLYDTTHFETSAVAMLKLPPTSIKGYANFVKQLAGATKKPPLAVVTLVKLVPDAKTQFKLTFQPMDFLPVSHLPLVMQRRAEVKPLLEQPYSLEVEEKKPAGKPVGKAAAKNSRPPVKRKY